MHLENGYIIEIDLEDYFNISDAELLARVARKYPNHTVYQYDLKDMKYTRLFIFADSEKSAIQHVFSVYDEEVLEGELYSYSSEE
jgi:hypothetical protein